MILAIFGGTFLDNSSGHFDPINYFFGAGIATNIGASLIWGFLAGLLGVFVARKVKAAWARLHTKIDAHHDELHERLDAHEEMHRVHAEKLDRLLAAQGPLTVPLKHLGIHTELPVEEGRDATT